MSIRAVIKTTTILYFTHWADNHFPIRIKGREKESIKKVKKPAFSSITSSSLALSRIFTPAKEIKEKNIRNIIIDKTPKFNLSNPQIIIPKETKKVKR